MATAEELLNQAAENGAVPTETKNYLTIDLHSRLISVPSIIKNIGVESDDEVNKLYFKIPRFYNEIDLSEFIIRINYTNADNEGDVYTATDVSVGDDEITFSWLVGRFAVTKQGTVNFIVCMVKTDEFGVVDREFNTTICSLPVLKGLETVKNITEDERDVIQSAAYEGARSVKVPKNVSELENDAGYITKDDISDISGATKMSQLEDDVGYLKESDIFNTEKSVNIVPPELTVGSLKSNGQVTSNTTWRTTDFIPLDVAKQNIHIAIKRQTSTWLNATRIVFYSGSTESDFLSYNDNSSAKLKTVAIPEGATYVRFDYYYDASISLKPFAYCSDDTEIDTSLYDEYYYKSEMRYDILPKDVRDAVAVTKTINSHMRNYEIDEGEILDELNSLDGFTQGKYPSGINFSFSLDTRHVKNKGASIKASITKTEGITEAAAIKINKAVSLDLSEKRKQVTFWMYVPQKYVNCKISVMFFTSASENNTYRAMATKYTNNMHPGWQVVSFGENDWKYGVSGGAIEDSSFDWSNINLMQINIGNSVQNYDFTCSISDLRIGKTWLPKIIHRFDDGLKGVYQNAWPALRDRGMSGIVYLNTLFTERADTSASGDEIIDPVTNKPYQEVMCTTEELTEMYNGGFDIGNHSHSHLVFDDASIGVHYGYEDTDTDEVKRTSVLRQILWGQRWLNNKGFIRSAKHFAVPGGKNTELCQAALDECGVLTSSNSLHDDTPPICDTHNIPAWGIGKNTTVETIKGWIDDAVTRGHTVVLMWHDIVDEIKDKSEGGNSEAQYQYLTSDFEAVLDYIVEQGWADYVVSMSEWYDGLNRPSTTAWAGEM